LDKWINLETGEIKDNVIQIRTKPEVEQQRQITKHYKNNVQPLPGFLQQEYGEFIQSNYLPLLKTINNDTAMAFRFMYLCTYMEYETGYLVSCNRKVDKHKLIKLLGVSPNTATNIIEYMTTHNLILLDSTNNYYINNIYSNKGRDIYKGEYTRVFIKSIRELYNKTDNIKSHKLLGRFILLLPYVNIYHNIICLNIKEKDINKLLLPNSRDLDKILNISERNSDRTIKEMMTIEVDGKPAMLNISHNKASMYAINPAIYYGGTNLSHLKTLDGYFKVQGGLN